MKYKVWITITITHGYHHPDNCGIILETADESVWLMKKADLLLHRQSNTKWMLLKPETEKDKVNPAELVLKEYEGTLNFNLIEKTHEFYYYTEWDKEGHNGSGWSLQNRKGPVPNKKQLQIRMTPDLLKRTPGITITIPNREAFWELILISRYNPEAYPVELRENTGKIKFSSPEVIPFPGEKKAFRCTSEIPIPMKEIYDYKISLWEKREKGERLLSSHIPHPRPDSVSVTSPQNMITSYFYF